MPGDGQEHRPRPVLLPSHPSSGLNATNLLAWSFAPSQAIEAKYSPSAGHMSIFMDVVVYSQAQGGQGRAEASGCIIPTTGEESDQCRFQVPDNAFEDPVGYNNGSKVK